MIKIHGGTPLGSKSLCGTCRNAHVIRGINLQEEVYCRQIAPMVRLHFPVETCNRYDDVRMPPLYEMQEIAWEVKSRRRDKLGFGGSGSVEEITIEPRHGSREPSAEDKSGE